MKLINKNKILNHLFISGFALIGLPLSQVLGSDFQSPRSMALGGATHANPLFSDALYLNPSYTSYIQTHSLNVNYLTYGNASLDTSQGVTKAPKDIYGHGLNFSVLDGSAESLFQAGAGFTIREDANLLHIGASKAVLKQLGIGLGSKFVFPKDNSGSRYIDGTFSATYLPFDWLITALIVDNLFQASTNLGIYREYVLGTKFNVMNIFSIYFDPHWVPTLPEGLATFGYEGGVEFPFVQEFFLRLGNFRSSAIPYESLRGHGWSLGFGWLGPKLALEYAFSHVTEPVITSAHHAGFSIYF